MKRTLWQQHITHSHFPAWPCPVCSKGVTRLREGSLNYEETVRSKRAHADVDWGPEYISFNFSIWAICSNDECKQAFSIAGTGGIDQFFDEEDGSSEWVEYFQPRYIHPTLQLIDVPSSCPRSVRTELQRVFELYWINREACANRLRTSLELLLTHVGAPTTEGPNGSNVSTMPLHRRIELYSTEDPAVAPHLMALKWLGNTGSHGRTVDRNELLDALQLLEHVLAEVLERRSKKLNELAAKLTRRHGPSGA